MKKYYTISEVSDHLGISREKLRKLESKYPSLTLSRFRGRRYYKVKDIEFLSSKLGKNQQVQTKSKDDFEYRIDSLINRLEILKVRLNSLIKS